MAPVTIGEVLNRLRGEFPEITVSKIRYLDAEGLVQPDRSEGGYRKFSAEDIERLRYVLRAQRDRFLPLAKIREELARLDRGLPVETPGPPTAAASSIPVGAPTGAQARAGGTVAPATAAPTSATPGGGNPLVPPQEPPPRARPSIFDLGVGELRLSESELAERSGLSTLDVTELRSAGILGNDATFDAVDLAIAKAAAELMGAGGLEPRHLRMYSRFVDNEVAQHEPRVRTLLRQRNPDSHVAARKGLDDAVNAANDLHRLLLGRAMRDLLGN